MFETTRRVGDFAVNKAITAGGIATTRIARALPGTQLLRGKRTE